MAVQEMQHRIAEVRIYLAWNLPGLLTLIQRVLRSSLARWTDRVIVLKSRELDIIQNCNMVALA